jgi:hypothetical protein
MLARVEEALRLMQIRSKQLAKKAKRGFRGYPIAVIACYGPTNRLATKIVASVILREDEEPADLRRWFSETIDVRNDPAIIAAILAFLKENNVLSVTMPNAIIGCPHEEGIDYDGEICPMCPFWANRDRWTGVLTNENKPK